MKASWKRILSLLLVAAMILTLGPTGFAVDLDEEIAIVEPEEDIALEQSVDEIQETEEGQSLWVGGVEVTEANASDILGDGKASYDFATNTLTFTAAVTFSGVHEGAIIYADTATPLTIVMPSGYFDISNNDAEVGIYTENGLIVNGDLTMDVCENEDGIGVKSMNGPVTVNGSVDIWSKETGIYCGKGDVTISGGAAFLNDSQAVYGLCPASCIYAADGGVYLNTFSFGTNVASYMIYANGPIHASGNVDIDNTGGLFGGGGIYSAAGGIVVDGNLTMKTGKVVCIDAGEATEGITVKGDANLTSSGSSAADISAMKAGKGPITVNGNLTVNCGGDPAVYALKDITVGGDANIVSKTYNSSEHKNRAMASEEGSIYVSGSLTASAYTCPVYAYNEITVDGNAKVSGNVTAYQDFILKADTGAISVGGNLTTTGLAPWAVYGGTGITVNGITSIVSKASATAGSVAEESNGMYTDGKISFGGKADVDAYQTAILAKDGIEIPDGYGVALPERGLVVQLEDGWTVTEPDKETVAAHAIISDKVNLEDGFYLIKPDWSVFEIASTDLFIPNPNNEAEYMLNTTLDVGEEIKVVRLENGAIAGWYPDGLNNQYHVDEAHSGDVTVYFKTSYDANWA